MFDGPHQRLRQTCAVIPAFVITEALVNRVQAIKEEDKSLRKVIGKMCRANNNLRDEQKELADENKIIEARIQEIEAILGQHGHDILNEASPPASQPLSE